MNTESVTKFNKVGDFLRGKNVLVAFSGGVDSTTLAKLAIDHAEKVLLLNVKSPLISDIEIERANRIANELGVGLQTIEFEWLKEQKLTDNPKDRCYQCKRKLAKLWKSIASDKELDLVIEGTSLSDLEGYRPGLRALKEFGIRSPFLDHGITKEEIRDYARERNLSVADKPSMACLATRFPYSTKITSMKLKMVDQIEQYIREEFQINCSRARFHRDLVRIEVGPEERTKLFDTSKLDKLYEYANNVGFKYVTIDVRGYRTGSLDESDEI